MPLRLSPTNSFARSAILVGDPGRALLLAQELLVEPKMSNHARGLWGYTASTPVGDELTVQSTGIGGPSAAVVLRDLAALGVRRAVRVGTCRALGPEVKAGALVAVDSAVVAAGSAAAITAERAAEAEAVSGSRAPGAERTGGPEPAPVARAAAGEWRSIDPPGGEPADSLRAAVEQAPVGGDEVHVAASVLSRDVDAAAENAAELAAARDGLASRRCQVADMQTGSLFAAGHSHGVELAAILIVEWSESGERLDGDELARQVKLAGRIAAAALGGGPDGADRDGTAADDHAAQSAASGAE